VVILSFDKSSNELQELYKRVGANISHLCKQRNLTQESLAADLNISSQALISQYENARKALTLEKIMEFCAYFNVPLDKILFFNLYIDAHRKKAEERSIKIPSEAPIQKCTGRTYYAYYLKEQNKGSSDFTSQISCFCMEVFDATSTHEAPAKLFGSNDNPIEGTLWMDESYAYATFHDPGKDLFWGFTFFYHRQRERKKYAGGMSLLQTLDYHILPICQYCILSSNSISTRHNSELKKLLQIDFNTNKSAKLSNRSFSSDALLRLTKAKDTAVFEWLKKNVHIQ